MKDKCVTENRIYYYKDKYYVVFESVFSPKLKRMINEYADKAEGRSILTARIKENGKLIADNNGVVTFGKYFEK